MLLSPHIVNIPDILFDSKTQKNHNWPHKLRIGQIMFGYFQFSFSRFPFCNNFMNEHTCFHWLISDIVEWKPFVWEKRTRFIVLMKSEPWPTSTMRRGPRERRRSSHRWRRWFGRRPKINTRYQQISTDIKREKKILMQNILMQKKTIQKKTENKQSR